MPAGNILNGLPALVGVLLGLKIFTEGTRVAIAAGILLVIAIAALMIGKRTMHLVPQFAGLLLELWILSAVAVTAFATAFVTWLSFSTPPGWLIDTSILSAEQLKTVQGTLLGALSTYVALVFTKDIGDAKGYFWTSTQFKDAMSKAMKRLTTKPPANSAAYQAIYLDSVDGHGNIGWGFKARRIRTKLLADFI